MKGFDVDRAASASGAASIIVNAPVETVWHFLTGIERWPLWNTEVSRVAVSGPMSVGTEFRWKAGGLPIRSRVEVLDPMRSIGWTGHAPLIRARHIYRLTSMGPGTRVSTEESFTGPIARLFPGWCASKITSSLEQGLAALRSACEHAKAEAEIPAKPAA
ncbi:hypothetical protein HKCCSP123_07645 [Rhodobacterales bacterium HKCCSP123]|nr:hypothetical protein [Rhodobacterales bacterium HKCCSP123]